MHPEVRAEVQARERLRLHQQKGAGQQSADTLPETGPGSTLSGCATTGKYRRWEGRHLRHRAEQSEDSMTTHRCLLAHVNAQHESLASSSPVGTWKVKPQKGMRSPGRTDTEIANVGGQRPRRSSE